MSADTTYLIIIYFGLSSIINIPIIKTFIWILGATVLIYLGFQSAKEFFEKVDLNKSKPITNRNSFIAGYMITISNPMTIVWWLGVFGSILGSSIQNISKMVALINRFLIIAGVLLWFLALCVLLHWGNIFINENILKYISLIAGIVLIGFGLHFGYNAFISII